MATTTQTPERAGLTWEQVCNDPNLRDLPYKIETNEYGQIVMSPTYIYHGKYAYRIARLLEQLLPEGEATVEAPVRTTRGTKVPDAVWMTSARWAQVKDAFDAPVAPEICVEVLSRSNTAAEIDEKKQLYFEAGAEEVWTCDRDGNVRFFDESGELEASKRAPDFPQKVEI